MDPQEPNFSVSPIEDPPTPQIPVSKFQPPKDNHWISILAMAIFVLFSLGVVAFLYYQNQQLKQMLAGYQPTPVASPTPTATPDPTADWKTFIHPIYKYQFKYPSLWSAKVSKDAKANTIFGLNATSQSGIGGIEVREIPTDPRDFHTLTQSKVIESESITINGIDGYKMKYSNIVNGTDFVFRNIDGLIYNIYINSENPDDLIIFDQILSTFKFSETTPPGSGSLNCQYNGKTYKDGSTVPSGDTCNTCSCDNGKVACTTMACP